MHSKSKTDEGKISAILSDDRGGTEMTQKEKLLQMKSYEEFDRNRELFKGMKPDKDIIEHLSRITPKSPKPQEELYKIPRSEGGSIGNCLESKGGSIGKT